MVWAAPARSPRARGVGRERLRRWAAEGAATRVNVVTELTLSGSVAQYGRGVGIIKEVCNQYAAQFAKNLAAHVQSGGTGAVPAEAKPLSAVALVSGAVRSMVARKPDPPSGPDQDGST